MPQPISPISPLQSSQPLKSSAQPQQPTNPFELSVANFGFLAMVVIILSVITTFFLPVRLKSALPETAPPEVKVAYSRVDTIADKFQGPVAVANFKKNLEAATTVDKPNPRAKANAEYDNYLSAFGGLTGAYYATGSPEILQLAKDLKEFVVSTYPEQYQTDLNSSPAVWEIREIPK